MFYFATGETMQFALSEEQAQLQEIARGFLDALPGARAVAEGHHPDEPRPWIQMVEEQAWCAIAIPEDLGGFGFGWLERCLVCEEVGRTLTPIPLLTTTMAAAVLLESPPSSTRDAALAALARGEIIAPCFDAVAVDATHAAQVILVDIHETRLVDAAHTRRDALPSLDPTRSLHRVTADPSQGVDLGTDLDRARARCETALAFECLGAAEACMDLTVAYAKVREQFGRPIGTFQAVQHQCADLLVAVECARSACWFAAWSIDADHPESRLAAHTAIATASEALFTAAGQSIQLHGGIGFTWEHDAHLYFKRARANLSLLGPPREHRHAVAAHLLGPA